MVAEAAAGPELRLHQQLGATPVRKGASLYTQQLCAGTRTAASPGEPGLTKPLDFEAGSTAPAALRRASGISLNAACGAHAFDTSVREVEAGGSSSNPARDPESACGDATGESAM